MKHSGSVYCGSNPTGRLRPLTLLVTFLLVTMPFVVAPWSFADERSSVRLVADEAWQPFIDPSLDDGGLVPSLVRAIFDEVGLAAEISYLSWSRVLREAARGDYQGIAGAYYSDERAEQFIYSEAFLRFRVSFMARRDFPIHRYDSLDALQGYVIGIIQDAAYPPELFDAGLTLHVSSTREGLVSMLKQGRIDLLADTEALFRHQALRQGINPDEFVSLSPPLHDEALFLAAPRALPDSQSLINRFNRGLVALQRDDRYLDIRRRHGF